MDYKIYSPPANLQRFIRFFWSFEADNDAAISFAQNSVASACSKMFFQYGGHVDIRTPHGITETLFQSGIQAHTQKFCHFTSTHKVGVLGVYFNPGALALMLSVAAHELSNSSVSLPDLLGQEGKDLQEKVILSTSNLQRVDLLIQFFEERLARLTLRDLQILDSIEAIADGQGLLSVQELVAQYSVSRRQLERHFQTIAGFSPKLLSRIIRFENSIQSFLNKPASLTDVAYRCGYFDQSHFIHDFKGFAGVQPREYFSQDFSMFTEM